MDYINNGKMRVRNMRVSKKLLFYTTDMRGDYCL